MQRDPGRIMLKFHGKRCWSDLLKQSSLDLASEHEPCAVRMDRCSTHNGGAMLNFTSMGDHQLIQRHFLQIIWSLTSITESSISILTIEDNRKMEISWIVSILAAVSLPTLISSLWYQRFHCIQKCTTKRSVLFLQKAKKFQFPTALLGILLSQTYDRC